MKEKAYAKLNISLDVSNRRPDGYHDMCMVMQSVTLADDVEVELNAGDTITAECNLPYIPCDERNLAVRAARVYLSRIGSTAGVHIKLDKVIPVGAGMAGGSSNAAAVLRAMNELFDNSLSKDELLKLAGEVGSDVAFCVLGGTALASGRGEILTSLCPLPDCDIVICKPEFSVSTPELFRAIDRIKVKTRPDTQGIISALEDGNLESVCRRMYNVFEDVGDRRMRAVAEIKKKLLAAGALGSIMTGTGSAVFGIFSSGSVPAGLCNQLKKEVDFVEMAKPVGRLI